MLNQKLTVAALFAATALPGFALAEDAPKPPEPPKPPYSLSANVFLVSDYYFRGITQTWGKPAIQGGFDFVHDSGIYLGTWASNVSGNQFAGGSLEWDFYGGYKNKINDDFTLGAGLYYYYQTFAKAMALIGKPTIVDDSGKEHNWRAELVAAGAADFLAEGLPEDQPSMADNDISFD